MIKKKRHIVYSVIIFYVFLLSSLIPERNKQQVLSEYLIEKQVMSKKPAAVLTDCILDPVRKLLVISVFLHCCYCNCGKCYFLDQENWIKISNKSWSQHEPTWADSLRGDKIVCWGALEQGTDPLTAQGAWWVQLPHSALSISACFCVQTAVCACVCISCFIQREKLNVCHRD